VTYFGQPSTLSIVTAHLLTLGSGFNIDAAHDIPVVIFQPWNTEDASTSQLMSRDDQTGSGGTAQQVAALS
jgi:hypothetical protein